MIVLQQGQGGILWQALTGKLGQANPTVDPVPIELEAKETWFQQNEIAFGNQNIVMDAVVLATWLKIYKTDPKLLAGLAEKYLDTVKDVIVATQRASAANWLNDLINQRLANNLMHAVGLITEEQRYLTNMWYDHIFALMWQKSFVTDTLTSLSTLGGDILGGIGKAAVT